MSKSLHYDIDKRLLSVADEATRRAAAEWGRIDQIRERNFTKVLQAFQEARITEEHFGNTSGYGYGDAGREGLEEVYARAFRGEAAIVRPQIVSGTHAITLCLFGLLLPGDEIVFATGRPYDTLTRVVGMGGHVPGALSELGVTWKEIGFTPEGKVDIERLAGEVSAQTKMVFIQRSRGYGARPSLGVREIGEIVQVVRAANERVIVLVDNCYGEFVEEEEPLEAGADVVAGSLIKNPGGCLAPCGGYVVGRKEYIERIASRVTAPGLGREVGPMLGLSRSFLQGFFFAPLVVAEALKGATIVANLFSLLGFEVSPRAGEVRHDIVESVTLGSREAVIAFARGFHRASAVGAFWEPKPAPMPGYGDEIIMAGGTFVQGSSIELSMDAPLRPPYSVFIQGGFMYEHARLAVLYGLCELAKAGFLPEQSQDR